ncbi:MAG: hypothetical protein GX116_01345 [Fibrobacter sp.]|jgi:hypothetical protein|nr:hypothetical protein [Fibrobacter sp.]
MKLCENRAKDAGITEFRRNACLNRGICLQENSLSAKTSNLQLLTSYLTKARRV